MERVRGEADWRVLIARPPTCMLDRGNDRTASRGNNEQRRLLVDQTEERREKHTRKEREKGGTVASGRTQTE